MRFSPTLPLLQPSHSTSVWRPITYENNVNDFSAPLWKTERCKSNRRPLNISFNLIRLNAHYLNAISIWGRRQTDGRTLWMDRRTAIRNVWRLKKTTMDPIAKTNDFHFLLLSSRRWECTSFVILVSCERMCAFTVLWNFYPILRFLYDGVEDKSEVMSFGDIFSSCYAIIAMHW